ncbi:unnamed protein product, partial [Didymodactylos carnosus]
GMVYHFGSVDRSQATSTQQSQLFSNQTPLALVIKTNMIIPSELNEVKLSIRRNAFYMLKFILYHEIRGIYIQMKLYTDLNKHIRKGEILSEKDFSKVEQYAMNKINMYINLRKSLYDKYL